MNPMHNEVYKQRFKDAIKAKQWISSDELFKLYKTDGLSVSEIAKLYNKKPYQVSYYLNKFNIHKDRHEVAETIKTSNIEKYGVDNIMKCQQGKDAYRKTMQEKYGERYSKNPLLQSKDAIKSAIIDVSNELGRKPHILELCNRFNITHSTLSVILQEYELYDLVERGTSRLESMFEDLIKKSNVKYIRNTRSVISPYELDFFIPEYNIAFEINDIASHSFDNDSLYGNKEQDYHQNKSLLCREKGILLIHIYEWELSDKKYLSKLNMYLQQLCGRTTRIYARKCELCEVDWTTTKQFLSEYHLQGAGMKSNINIGLYYENELVSVMTFSKSRYSNKYEYELLRLCSKSTYSVIGGASKMFKYFIDKYSPGSIVSYCSLDTMKGTIYPILNFEYDGITSPTYTWCNVKLETYNWKTILDKGVDNVLGTHYGKGQNNVELMNKCGFTRIYNAGNVRFVWRRSKV